MKFLSLQTALWATAIAIPLLLLLYFLKLRRIERTISSTLLWKKAVQDLQVNSPFQRLRKNLLLLLQLLVLAAVLFGLANPIANMNRVPGRRVVLLIDHSGSMNAIEGDGKPRLDHAKRAAVSFVDEMPAESRAMVISFADRASVVCSFTDDKRRLRELIRAIPSTDSPSRIGEAMQLAAAQGLQGEKDAASADPSVKPQASPIEVELFSDGRIADVGDSSESVTANAPAVDVETPATPRATQSDLDLRAIDRVQYFRIGESVDNVGIVAFDVRRDFERPGFLSFFVEVENFGPTAVTSDVTLSLDGKLLPGSGAVQEVTLGPSAMAGIGGLSTTRPTSSRPQDISETPSSRTILFEFEHDAEGVVTIRWERPDALAIDNAVSAPIEPPRPIRVLIVSNRPIVDFWVRRPMADFGVRGVESISTKQYESAPESKLSVDGRSAYDVVFLDNHDTDRLPPGNYVFFNGLPKVEGISRGDEVVGKPLVYGRESHPLLRAVSYESIYVGRWRRLKLPAFAMPLIEGEDSTVAALLADPGHRYVILAFDLLESDFSFRPSFPMFLQNIVGYLAGGGVSETGRMARPGETVTIPVPGGAEKLTIHRPDATEQLLETGGRMAVQFASTREVGVFRATFDDAKKSSEAFTVNLLDATESRIEPKKEIAMPGQRAESVEDARKVPQSLWPYAVAAALAFVMLEWWVYNRRVMV